MTKKPKKTDAKKSTAKAKATAAAEAAPTGNAGQTTRMISAGQLKGLLKSKRLLSEEMNELTGGYRAKLAFAVDKQHLHSKAYATVVAMDKMEPEKLAEYWDVLNAYMDMSGLTKRIESVGRLDLADSREGEDDEDQEDPAESRPTASVARPQFGARAGDDHVKKQVDAMRANSGASPSASAAE